MNLDLLESCTHVRVEPRFNSDSQVLMLISVWRNKTQLAPEFRTTFAECAKLLTTIRERGFRTASIDDLSMTLERNVEAV